MTNLDLKNDLEKRCTLFAKEVARLIKELPVNIINREYASQIIRSSSSIGANYIEANEAESRKDFFHRIKISRKEARETKYWLELLKDTNKDFLTQIEKLESEIIQLIKIFSAVINSQNK